MLDFSSTLGQEMIRAKEAEINDEAWRRRWNRRLRELKQQDARAAAIVRGPRRPFRDDASRRRELFVTALDAAQREGITIDAWFNYRFRDPELSARAEWAGLIDDAAKTAKDAWAA
jgi:hypothetical protein